MATFVLLVLMIFTTFTASALVDEITKASEARDSGKVQQLTQLADDLKKVLGPEFVRLDSGLHQVDFQSAEGQQLSAEFEKLDQFCAQE